MNGPTYLTLFRISLAPLWATLFYLYGNTEPPSLILLIALWVLFVVSELSDIIDGVWARRTKQITDLGKVMDPFADVVSRLTAFYMLSTVEMIPFWVFLILMYRELGAIFIRLLFIKQGFAMPAGLGGKVKAWFYFLTILVALMLFSAETWDAAFVRLLWMDLVLYVLIGLSLAMSLYSFGTYLKAYIKYQKKSSWRV
jgi:CDP-diacylglycerol--glycerol-3-phosphate 3-phosphatidyltransferase